MKQSQLAINTITLNQAPFDEQVAAVAAAGFANIELYLPAVKKWQEAGGRSDADARRLLDEHGLTCIGGFEAPVLAFGEDAKRERNHALHQRNAELLATLGEATVMVVGTDGPGPESEVRGEAALGRVGEALAQLVEKVAGSVRLAVEFNWSPVVRSLRSAVRVVEAAGHERVGWLFDPAHYHCTATKPEDITAEAVASLFHVHVDNMADKPGEHSHCNDDRVLPGEAGGVLELGALMGQIEAAGYGGYFSLEMFDKGLWAMEAGEAARRCREAMLGLVDAAGGCAKSHG